jgi:hypothetical protein
MRELKLALRQLERAHRRSVRFAQRAERGDPELAARARREADDVARVIAEYRTLIDLGTRIRPVREGETATTARESVPRAQTDAETES